MRSKHCSLLKACDCCGCCHYTAITFYLSHLSFYHFLANSTFATLWVLIGPSADQGAVSFLIEGGTKPRLHWPHFFSLDLIAPARWHQGAIISLTVRLLESSKLLWSLPFQKLACWAVDWILWDVQDPFSIFFLCLYYPWLILVIFNQRSPISTGRAQKDEWLDVEKERNLLLPAWHK